MKALFLAALTALGIGCLAMPASAAPASGIAVKQAADTLQPTKTCGIAPTASIARMGFTVPTIAPITAPTPSIARTIARSILVTASAAGRDDSAYGPCRDGDCANMTGTVQVACNNGARTAPPAARLTTGASATNFAASIPSGLPLGADIVAACGHFAFVPQGDICSAAKEVLFDHLVGECEQRRRHLEAKRPCGLEVDHELELGRLLDCELGDDLRAVTF